MGILLGAIADDFTGASDLANTLVGQGMPTVQAIGVPGDDFDPGDAAAVVIALKSRTIPAADAVEQSVAALNWLTNQGARQFFFKYCSTFDSTDEGNIGPVADALMDALGTDFTIACPAFPANGRTIYRGHLFVGDVLLSDSSMKDHPLTPMTDSNLVRVLGRQTDRQVGAVTMDSVAAGSEAIAAAFTALRQSGTAHAVVDAISDDDLFAIGAASADLSLLTGGSGVALGLPENFRKSGLLSADASAATPRNTGRAGVLAGSCSAATREQVARAEALWPAYRIDAFDVAELGDKVVNDVLDWIDQQDPAAPLMVYSSADPKTVAETQSALGRADAGALLENAMGEIAKGMSDRGFRRLIVAGGETSGRVVQVLNVNGLKIGPEIDPGVPWTETMGGTNMALALKSGNFGGPEFFMKAFDMLEQAGTNG